MKTPYSLVASAYLVLAVAWVAPAADSTPAASTSAASKPTPAERPSLWGQAVSGVQARLFMPTEVEQDALVPIRLEIANDPDRLPAGVGRFDTFLLQTRVVVSMTQRQNQAIADGEAAGPRQRHSDQGHRRRVRATGRYGDQAVRDECRPALSRRDLGAWRL